MNRIQSIIAISLILGGNSLAAQNLKGAHQVIEDSTPSSSNKGGEMTSEAFLKRIDLYLKDSKKMSPEEVASGWLNLYDQESRLKGDDRSESTATAFSAFPPPSQWDSMVEALMKKSSETKGRRQLAYRLFADLLRNDQEKVVETAQAIRASLSNDIKTKSNSAWDLRRQLADIDRLLMQQIAAINPEKRLEIFKQILSDPSSYKEDRSDIPTPNLTSYDKDKIEPLVLNILKQGIYLEAADEKTNKLISQIVMAHLDEFTIPPWKIAVESRNEDLALKIHEKFKDSIKNKNINSSDTQQALTFLFNTFIKRGRFEEADRIIDTLPEDDLDGMTSYYGRHGIPTITDENIKNIRSYYIKALSKNPSLPFWKSLVEVIKPGDAEAWGLIEKAISSKTIKNDNLVESIKEIYIDHLFSLSKFDEAMAELQLCIDSSSGRNQISLLTRQAKVYLLTERKELAEKTLSQIKSIQLDDQEGWDSQLVELAIKLGDYSLVEQLAEACFKSKENEYYKSSAAADLTRAYAAAGRMDDVLIMTDECPYWDSTDLQFQGGYYDSQLKEVRIAVARALLSKERTKEAVKIIKEIIRFDTKNDAAYELLIKADAKNAYAFLEEIAQSHPFEERPLIWLAQLQSDSGNLELAEKTVKQAIAMDPSDGEMGKNDRMRVYRVYGQILKKRGDDKDSQFMEKINQAIRMSEDADDWWEAGLILQALNKYEQALQIFADAYCIQSRMALRYEEMGESGKALEHYQKAFELMPGSFGRIESHCFGCEGAFSSPLAQNAAEKIFQALAEKPDAKPQVFYLLGYLRQSQNRNFEAAGYFEKAVQMDPEYVNAWKNLANISDEAGLPIKKKDDAILKYYSLMGDSNQLSNVSDVRLLWETVLNRREKFPALKPEKNIYPLAAARKRLDEEKEKSTSSFFGIRNSLSFIGRGSNGADFNLKQLNCIQIIDTLLTSNH
jgi:tetratricopeptide (TPR) repeat protein